MFPTVVIRALFVDSDRQGKEVTNTRVLVMQNCPLSLNPGDWVVSTNKTGDAGGGLEIAATQPEIAHTKGEWIRIYNSDPDRYGSCHPIDEAEIGFRADDWEVLTLEEAQRRYPWSIILRFE